MTLNNICRSTLIVGSLVAASALVIGENTAQAGVAPVLNFSIDVSGGSGYSFSDSYDANVFSNLGNGQFAYEIDSVFKSEFEFSPTSLTIGSGAPTSLPAGILTGLTFKNTTDESLEVVITYIIDTDFAGLTAVPWETNVSIGVNSNTTVNSFDGMPLWSVWLDGATVGQLFTDPVTLQGIDGAGSADMSLLGAGDSPTSTMAIQIAFEINAGGQVSFNGNFLMIPAPGALALLAIGGLIGIPSRRRRIAS